MSYAVCWNQIEGKSYCSGVRAQKDRPSLYEVFLPAGVIPPRSKFPKLFELRILKFVSQGTKRLPTSNYVRHSDALSNYVFDSGMPENRTDPIRVPGIPLIQGCAISPGQGYPKMDSAYWHPIFENRRHSLLPRLADVRGWWPRSNRRLQVDAGVETSDPSDRRPLWLSEESSPHNASLGRAAIVRDFPLPWDF
jgi:hypothetical protein